MEIGDQVAVRIDEKSGAEAFRRADLHDGLAELFDEVLDIARDDAAVSERYKIAARHPAAELAGTVAVEALPVFVMPRISLRGTTSTV